LILLRQALIHAVKAVDAALLELYGWTPRRSSTSVDISAILEVER
jgi:hypothetical protein